MKSKRPTLCRALPVEASQESIIAAHRGKQRAKRSLRHQGLPPGTEIGKFGFGLRLHGILAQASAIWRGVKFT